MSKTNNGANFGFENQMWVATDKCRNSEKNGDMHAKRRP